jgi:ABC-type glutathione transport system ATPase component
LCFLFPRGIRWYFSTATNCTLNYGRSIDRRNHCRYLDYWVKRQMEALLQVRNLDVRYRAEGGCEHRAVADVSFDIGSGEVLGLIGESGCGKTSLALTLLRLHPTQSVNVSGSVLFGGQELLTLDERSLEEIRGAKISFVSQEPGIALSPVLRVGDQVAEVLHAHNDWSWKRCRAEAESWFARVNLNLTKRFFSAYPHQLSGGQLQRVVLAQALACSPALLIADEPTAALDGRNQVEFLALLRGLKGQIGLSVLLINHAPEIQASLSDRLLVMKAGEIVEQGSFAQLYHSPSHTYTRAMLRRSSHDRARESHTVQMIGEESLA